MGKLNAILDDLIAKYRDRYPPPTDHAFQTQRSQLQQAAKVFLIEEHRYCAENKGTPVYLESSFGLTREGHSSPLDTPEPVPVKLADGSVIRACGRVDRIDRIGQGAVETYAVWDYKSGSAWKYDEADPFRQGRVVQPTLYIAMVAHRLRASMRFWRQPCGIPAPTSMTLPTPASNTKGLIQPSPTKPLRSCAP